MSAAARALLLALALAPAAEAADGGAAPALPAARAAQNRLLDIGVAGERAIAVGQQGVILVSADGRDWQQRPAPVSSMLTRLRVLEAHGAWALGYEGTILQSVDGGATWSLRHHDAQAPALYDLHFSDAQHGIAVGAYGTLLETADGGATWTARDTVLGEIGMHVNVLVPLPNGSLVAAGERGLVAVSRDGGGAWELIDAPYGGSWFGALPHGDAGVVLFGMRGNVFVADDLARCPRMAAASWDPYTRVNLEDAQAIAARGFRRIAGERRDSLFGGLALDERRILLVGFNGTLQQLDLGAGTLSVLSSPAHDTLVRLARFHGRLLAVGRRGVQDLGPAP